MDGMLSQDEISALLNGMDLSADGAENLDSTENLPKGDAAGDISNESTAGSTASGDGELLTDVEKDAIGEVANISMGSSATTLYSLVNKKVNITTPVVTLATWNTLLGDYEKPCVFIQIKYTKGLDGMNILVLKEHDVKVIADLMMGGDGTNTDGELGELHLSAISEAMNQMMGSAATSLSTMLQTVIDISPPESTLVDLSEFQNGGDVSPFLGGTFVKIAFRMQIDDLVDSTIIQLYPIEFARKVVETFFNSQSVGASESVSAPEQEMNSQQTAPAGDSQGQAGYNMGSGINPSGMNSTEMNQAGMSADAMNPNGSFQGMNPSGMNSMGMNQMGMNQMNMNPMGTNQMNMGQMGMNQMGMNQMGMNQMSMGQMGMNMNAGGFIQPMGMSQMGAVPQMNQQNVNVQPAQFQNFSSNVNSVPGQENIGLIMDVPLEVTVELGRTTKSISEILDFAPGTIIELDRIAGEPIDVLVNGKFVAKGEVVVIEESFGVRVTEIIK